MSWVEDSQGWDSVATLAWSQGRWGGPCFPLILPPCGQNLNLKKPRAPQLNQGRRVLSGILSPLASRSR